MIIQSKVRIAEERLSKVLVRTLMVLAVTISIKASVSISFDTVVYDKHKPNETMVESYLFSRDESQSSAEMLKNAKVLKNLHRKQKTVNLSSMDRTTKAQKSECAVTTYNANHYAHRLKLKFSLKCALDIRLIIQSKVRIAEERLSKVLVRTLMVLAVTISIKASVSIM
ncbi:hypothetical protein [Empedobacter tilapiae]|uniref:Uncharacterized protein n=1 Tax=Empedobacter tilapiae TaxID=2491114 RepID=A0A4Z1BDM8_9FLAO|nr:hypothetical protein [Empedobacter tilapiae]TGN22542.1 hypothetical protein E4J94_15975 [Empedobacter tilapiae]